MAAAADRIATEVALSNGAVEINWIHRGTWRRRLFVDAALTVVTVEGSAKLARNGSPFWRKVGRGMLKVYPIVRFSAAGWNVAVTIVW